MVLGNPYSFSILIETVKEWNIDNTFCNGILVFCADGIYYPSQIITAALKCEIRPLIQGLKNITVDAKLYSVKKNEAFAEIYNITFPSNWDTDNNSIFNISPLSFSDVDCYAFAVSNGKMIRIMLSNLNYIKAESRHDLKNNEVQEVYITIEELNKIIAGLEEYCKILEV